MCWLRAMLASRSLEVVGIEATGGDQFIERVWLSNKAGQCLLYWTAELPNLGKMKMLNKRFEVFVRKK